MKIKDLPFDLTRCEYPPSPKNQTARFETILIPEKANHRPTQEWAAIQASHVSQYAGVRKRRRFIAAGFYFPKHTLLLTHEKPLP